MNVKKKKKKKIQLQVPILLHTSTVKDNELLSLSKPEFPGLLTSELLCRRNKGILRML